MTEPVAPTPPEPKPPGDEHPLSILLYSWMRGRDGDRRVLAIVAAVCAVLAVLDLLINRYPSTLLEKTPVFFGLFGFAALAIALLSGFPFGKLLRRPEDFYDDVKRANAPEQEERRDD